MRCDRGHIARSNSVIPAVELLRASNFGFQPWSYFVEVTAKIASAESKSERVVESSITLVRCVNAESAELRSR